jgi:hypothetical protein
MRLRSIGMAGAPKHSTSPYLLFFPRFPKDVEPEEALPLPKYTAHHRLEVRWASGIQSGCWHGEKRDYEGREDARRHEP